MLVKGGPGNVLPDKYFLYGFLHQYTTRDVCPASLQRWPVFRHSVLLSPVTWRLACDHIIFLRAPLGERQLGDLLLQLMHDLWGYFNSVNDLVQDCGIYRVLARALYYYCDMMLLQDFGPMAVQLSLKSALSLAERNTTASDHHCNTGPNASVCEASLKNIGK